MMILFVVTLFNDYIIRGYIIRGYIIQWLHYSTWYIIQSLHLIICYRHYPLVYDILFELYWKFVSSVHGALRFDGADQSNSSYYLSYLSDDNMVFKSDLTFISLRQRFLTFIIIHKHKLFKSIQGNIVQLIRCVGTHIFTRRGGLLQVTGHSVT